MKKKEKRKIIIIVSILLVIILIVLLLINSKKTGLSYEITYNGINCPTPYVVFYDNGTYEYYEHYGIGEQELKPQKGKYEYDMSKLIQNIDKYEEDSRGPYGVKMSNGEEYTTYSTNKELRELLDGNNIVLEKCMTQEDE